MDVNKDIELSKIGAVSAMEARLCLGLGSSVEFLGSCGNADLLLRVIIEIPRYHCHTTHTSQPPL